MAPILTGMGAFRAASHVEFRSGRTRVSVTFTVAVVTDGLSTETTAPRRRRVCERNWVPAGLTNPNVKWDVLPGRIRPEDWITEQADPAVPGSVMAAEAKRRIEGFYSVG